MKIVSFNVNGIRARLHQLQSLVERHQPDIVALQEIKVRDEEFPADAVREMGYHPVCFGQKSHYGVALLSLREPARVQRGFPDEGQEAQRRLLAADYRLDDGRSLWVLNGYFPQGERRDHPQKFPAKARFFTKLHAFIRHHFSPEDRLLVLGDFNVAPEERDIGIGVENARRWLRTGKCCFLPEERQWFQELQDWGLVDTYRLLHSTGPDRFSWFDYRSQGFEREPKRGLRIDLILASRSLAACCLAGGIDYHIRAMQRPSDHCPVWVDFALPDFSASAGG